MITTVVFDIGNVLMDFDYRPFLKELLKYPALADRVDRAIWGSRYWRDMDLGMDLETARARMIALDPSVGPEITLALDRVGECMVPEPYAIGWVQDLKSRGYRVLYLSNYSEYSMAVGPEALSFLPYMDGGVFSCRVKLGKPDPAIYRRLLSDYALTPGECVFIDDNEENVSAARALGMQGVRFTGCEATKAALDALLSAQGKTP